MEHGYKVDKSLHHVSPCRRTTNNSSAAGNMMGPDLRLDEKEKTIVAKQPVEKKIQLDKVTRQDPSYTDAPFC